jgi:hypothetical protein
MKKINICIIKPKDYIHSYAFWELAELIYFSLIEIGFESRIVFNNVEPDIKNILIGCHLLDPKLIEKIPKSTIILNTEQIYSDNTEWNENIFAWVTRFEVWDYSIRNIEKLKQIGVNRVKLFKIGYQKELARLDMTQKKDVDVLFYGAANDRRKKIIKNLLDTGLNVKALFGVYGKERDAWIERSKLVLNFHFYDSQIFEIVRVFYLLTNSVAVVGEVNESTSIDDMCKEGVHAVKYDDLVNGCIELVNNDSLRKRLEIRALNSIYRYPQKEFTQEMLDS